MLLLGGWDSSPHGSVPDTPCQWAALLDVKSRLEGGGGGCGGDSRRYLCGWCLQAGQVETAVIGECLLPTE